ncbi:MAG: hypothetical protein ACKO3T_12275 [Planctomycetaceae bacterium]|jgi:hypothetical protein
MYNRRMAQITASTRLLVFCARIKVGQTDDANSVLLTRPLIIGMSQLAW